MDVLFSQSMDQYDIRNLISERVVVFVAATAGQGL
jgi:hypothetical protein